MVATWESWALLWTLIFIQLDLNISTHTKQVPILKIKLPIKRRILDIHKSTKKPFIVANSNSTPILISFCKITYLRDSHFA